MTPEERVQDLEKRVAALKEDMAKDVKITFGPAVMETITKEPGKDVRVTFGPAVIHDTYEDLGTLPPLNVDVVEKRGMSFLPWVLGGAVLLFWRMRK